MSKQMLTVSALEEIAKETKECEYKGMTYVIRKLKGGELEKLSKKENPIGLVVDCVVEPELTPMDVKKCGIHFIQEVNKEIADFNELDVEQVEKN